jgi:hypothetical protein
MIQWMDYTTWMATQCVLQAINSSVQKWTTPSKEYREA